MTGTEDKLGVVRDHRWMKAAEQRRRLEAEGCRGLLDFDGKNMRVSQADLIRMSTAGRTFVLVHAFLLADPSFKNRRGGIKANFDDVVDKISARGAVIMDLETGLTTADKQHRKAIAAVSYDNIARSNQGLKSNLNGKRSKGRPKAWIDPAERKIAWEEWHSALNVSNAAAAKAASERLGKEISPNAIWRIVRDMRRERGEAPPAKRKAAAGPALLGGRGVGINVSRVYFALCGSKVKIGTTYDLKNRMKSLRAGMPDKLKVLVTIAGGHRLERSLHARFARYRMNGEWFRHEGELAEYIQSLRKQDNR